MVKTDIRRIGRSLRGANQTGATSLVELTIASALGFVLVIGVISSFAMMSRISKASFDRSDAIDDLRFASTQINKEIAKAGFQDIYINKTRTFDAASDVTVISSPLTKASFNEGEVIGGTNQALTFRYATQYALRDCVGRKHDDRAAGGAGEPIVLYSTLYLQEDDLMCEVKKYSPSSTTFEEFEPVVMLSGVNSIEFSYGGSSTFGVTEAYFSTTKDLLAQGFTVSSVKYKITVQDLASVTTGDGSKSASSTQVVALVNEGR